MCLKVHTALEIASRDRSSGSGRVPWRSGPAWSLPVLAFTGAIIMFLPGPLWAIPSPDLVVNLFASAAQALGLLTVLLGGMAYTVRRRRARNSGGGAGLRWAFRVSLVLFLSSLAGNVLQYSYHTDRQSDRLRTNLWRTSVEQGKKVGDVDLKELPYSQQIKHPRGLETSEFSRWLAEDLSLNLIDVREPEEIEMGRIAGSWHIRYPDLRLQKENLIVEGKRTVLLCFNGNRSSELSNEFFEEGIFTYFMIGGYEKWIAEERPLDLARARTPEEIRDIPDYPNKERLLDTPEVMEMVQKEEALFVDVRYPGEFEKDSLPDAINITMRKLPTDELWAQLKSIPQRPIIAPCYDKRSSFFALILGLRLHRLGYDFRGRYTVPQEFSLPKAEKFYVAQWKQAQEDKTLLGMVAQPLKGALDALSEKVGHLGLAILLLVVCLRLLILPLTLKADRDQIVQRRLAPQAKALKEKLADDPQRYFRAFRSLQRREGLTPLRNLAGTLVLITLFVVFFSVVNRAAADSTQGFLWIEKLADPDPLYILPSLVAGLIFLHLTLTARKRTLLNLVLHALCGALLFVLTFTLRAGVNLYLALNVALMLLQVQATRFYLNRSRKHGETSSAGETFRTALRYLKDAGVILLRIANRVPGAGNKAIRLAELAQNGLPVPDGFVVTDKILSRGKSPATPPAGGGDAALDGLRLSDRERRQIERAWRRIGAERVAVRSSGLNEDGTSRSYAGVFESILNVRRENLFEAIETVHSSLSSYRASIYGGNGEERGAILVQAMVDAQYAGVLFTEHPASAGCSLVELTPGLGDALVSGSTTPQSYRFGRVSGRLLESRKPPIDLGPLLVLGRKVEALFGKPQDIEWAYDGRRFLLLQARDITTSVRGSASLQGVFERERHRLLDLARASGPQSSEILFCQNELSELLPRPTPLSHSLMEQLWEVGGSTDLACRSLGVPYHVEEDSPPCVNSIFGALYVNRLEGKRRVGKGPGAIAAFKLSRSAEGMRRHFKEEFLPGFAMQVRLRDFLDYSRLSLAELFSLLESWLPRFIKETYVEAEVINVAADFYVKTATQELKKKGMDPALYLAKIPETVVHQAMSLLPAIKAGERSLEDFLELFGHRAPQDYELSQPRYRESPELVEELLRRAQKHAAARELPAPEAGPDRADGLELMKHPMLALAVERAREFQSLKEEAKHHCLRELATIRSLLVELDGRLELDSGIFFLTLEEVSHLKEESYLDQALDLIDRRRVRAEAWKSLQLPSELSVENIEALEFEGNTIAGVIRQAGDVLRGTRVSGETEVVGRVRVIHDPDEVDSFCRGEVLVARFTDPTWTPLFPLVGGVITEVGGWLSHAAIVAREYQIPAIVGARGAMEILGTGDLVRLRLDGTIEKVATNRRRHQRVPVSARVALLRQGELVGALLRDLSVSGALIEVDEDLKEGQGVHIRISADREEVRAEVVRRDPSGGYALEFKTPLAGPLPALPLEGGPGKN